MFQSKYRNFILFSPHLDDAVLSAGFLIDKLIKSGRKALIVNIFTKATEKPYGEPARLFLAKCGYSDAMKLFSARKKEDSLALKYYSVSFLNLDYIDATFRKAILKWPYFRTRHLYPSAEKLFSGKFVNKDNLLVGELEVEFKKILSKYKTKDTLILAPLAVGDHVDHVIVRDVVRNLGYKMLFWEDYPYNLDRKKVGNFLNKNVNYKLYCSVDGDRKRKRKAIGFYKTQIKALFPQGVIPLQEERYYIQI